MYKEHGIDTGHMIKTMCGKPPLTKEKENELGRRIQGGDMKARNELVEHNLRLIVPLAKQYRHANVEFKDLFMVGALGVMRAADKFNPDLKHASQFACYATWWILHYIRRFLANNKNLVKPPASGQDSTHTIYVEDLKYNVKYTKSIDIDFTYLLGKAKESEERMADPILSKTINKILSRAGNKTAIMLKQYFGVEGQQMTLTEIGKLHGYKSRESTKQALLNGIKKIRATTNIKKLMQTSDILEQKKDNSIGLKESSNKRGLKMKLFAFLKE